MSKIKLPLTLSILILSILAPTTLAFTTKLNDVPTNDPNLGVFTTMVESKIFSLDNLGNFHPNDPINKAAFLKAALSYAGFTPTKSFNNFTGYIDVPESSWFAPYVKKAINIRVIENPILNSNFYPDHTLTRQDALILALKIYGIPTPLSEPTTKELFTDIRPTHPLAYLYKAAFLSGIYFEESQKEFKPNKILTRGDAADLLFKTKFASGRGTTSIQVSPVYPATNTSSTGDLLNNEKFGIFLDTWDKINQQFIYADKVNSDQLIYGAISGMVDQLGDPYSNFKAPGDDGSSYIYIPENYEGIGAVIDFVNNNYIIQSTINNSPAYRAGLKSQDIIMLLNGQSITNLSPDQVTALIKGKAGTYLKIQVKRGESLLNFDIIREKISIDSVYKELVGNNINYLRIDQFTENTANEFDSYLTEIKNSGSNKLILDLRNNPGGYLTSTQSILGHFITNSQAEFYTQDKSGAQTPYYSEGTADLKNFRMVVLINEGSASAAEIMAGALQDLKLAYLIGTTSFGKGSVQEITSYIDNSSLKLSVAQWLTPLKRNINHVGIVPDQKVSITDIQKANGQDPQLDAAITYLR